MTQLRNKVLRGSIAVLQKSYDLERTGARTRAVRINETRLRVLAEHFDHSKLVHWTKSSPVSITDLPEEERLGFLFVFNAISFSYYPDPNKPKWKVEYRGKTIERGTWSMLAALKKGVDSLFIELESSVLLSITQERLRELLKGEGKVEIPLLEERFRILRALARVIHPHRFRAFVAEAVTNGNPDEGQPTLATALNIVDYIISKIPSFEDTATYEGIEVPFNKRAQLLVSDIHELMPRPNIYTFNGIDELTACADYILPMVLRHFGILEYSRELAHKVDRRIPLPLGGVEEVEIRANTIVAVYNLSQLLSISQMRINDYLWNLGPELPESREHHLVEPRTTAY